MCNVPPISEYNCGNYLFFKLADEVPSTSLNTDQIVTDLKQECDDFKAALEEKFNSGAFVTETWRSEDGNNWYRIWSDGWIEQGGYIINSISSINFHTPFTNVNYFFSRTGVGTNTTACNYHAYAGFGTEKTDTRTTTGISFYTSVGVLGYLWYAFGY